MPDLQTFARARLSMLALDFWKPTLPHLRSIIRAVFGTQGNDHPNLQGPVLERCVGVYKKIIADPVCIDAMDTYPDFSRAILQAVGKSLEDEKHRLSTQNKQFSEEIDDLGITVDNQAFDISGMQSALRLVHEKLDSILTKRQRSDLTSRRGSGRVPERTDAVFQEIKRIARFVFPDIEIET